MGTMLFKKSILDYTAYCAYVYCAKSVYMPITVMMLDGAELFKWDDFEFVSIIESLWHYIRWPVT